MKILVASDHAGFNEKQALIQFLNENFQKIFNTPLVVRDLGTHSGASVHYPHYAINLCKDLLNSNTHDHNTKGILICGSGIGMSIVANKFRGIRAALCRDENEAKLSREHNDANILCLGTRTTPLEKLKSITMAWLSTSGAEGRHLERVAMINELGQELL